jgi:hypothetical protein
MDRNSPGFVDHRLPTVEFHRLIAWQLHFLDAVTGQL